jgi:hypothetical protein
LTAVASNTPAFHCGAVAGCEIIAVGGVDTSSATLAAVKQRMQACGDTITLTLQRPDDKGGKKKMKKKKKKSAMGGGSAEPTCATAECGMLLASGNWFHDGGNTSSICGNCLHKLERDMQELYFEVKDIDLFDELFGPSIAAHAAQAAQTAQAGHAGSAFVFEPVDGADGAAAAGAAEGTDGKGSPIWELDFGAQDSAGMSGKSAGPPVWELDYGSAYGGHATDGAGDAATGPAAGAIDLSSPPPGRRRTNSNVSINSNDLDLGTTGKPTKKKKKKAPGKGKEDSSQSPQSRSISPEDVGGRGRSNSKSGSKKKAKAAAAQKGTMSPKAQAAAAADNTAGPTEQRPRVASLGSTPLSDRDARAKANLAKLKSKKPAGKKAKRASSTTAASSLQIGSPTNFVQLVHAGVEVSETDDDARCSSLASNQPTSATSPP